MCHNMIGDDVAFECFRTKIGQKFGVGTYLFLILLLTTGSYQPIFIVQGANFKSIKLHRLILHFVPNKIDMLRLFDVFNHLFSIK